MFDRCKCSQIKSKMRRKTRASTMSSETVWQWLFFPFSLLMVFHVDSVKSITVQWVWVEVTVCSRWRLSPLRRVSLYETQVCARRELTQNEKTQKERDKFLIDSSLIYLWSIFFVLFIVYSLWYRVKHVDVNLFIVSCVRTHERCTS